MARGFDTTFGSASTDKISGAAWVTPTEFSFSAWIWRNGEGGLSSGRIFDKSGAGGPAEIRLLRSGSANLTLTRDRPTDSSHNTTDAAAVATSKWFHICVVHDGTTGAPLFYINGNSVTVNTSNAGSGALTLGSGEFTIGNRSTSGTQWDGMIGGRPTVWGKVLTAAEVKSLYCGADPAFIQPYYIKESIDLGAAAPRSLIYSTQPVVTGTKIRGDRIIIPEASRFPFANVPASGINGTAAITDADDTLAATGTVLVAGVAAITEADDTASSASGVLIAALLAATDGDDTLAATSTLAIAAVLAATEAGDTLASTGTLPIVGTLSATEADDTLSATGVGSSINTGSLSVTDADDTVSAEGTLALSGVVSITEASDTASGAAGLSIVGTASITDGDDTSAATGGLALKGVLSANDNDDTLAAVISLSSEAVSRLTALRPASGASRLRTNLSTGSRPAAVSRG